MQSRGINISIFNFFFYLKRIICTIYAIRSISKYDNIIQINNEKITEESDWSIGEGFRWVTEN